MAVCGAAAAAADSSYQFTVLAKQGDTFDGQSLRLPQGAGINASGTIVYTAAYVCGPMAQFCQYIFQTTLSNLGSSPTVVTNDGGGTPRIDDNGTILFACSGGALCTQSGVIANPGDTTGGNGPISHIDDWAISPGGDIVFVGNWQHQNSDGTYQFQYGLLTPSDLFVAGCESTEAGETTEPCTGPSGNIIDGTNMLAVGVPIGFNPNGDWAFNCAPDPGMPFQLNSPAREGICTREHILVQQGSVIAGNTLTNASLIGTTTSGTLVFAGDSGQSVGSRAIYSLNPTGVVVQPGDTVAGHPIDAIYGANVLSSGGTLAFLAHFVDSDGSQGSGVFIKSATGSTLVLKQGDTIDGITINNITPNAVRDDGTVVLTISNAGAAAALVAQPVLVQSASVSGSAVPSVSAAFPSDNTSGNLIVAFVRMSTTSQTISVSDTAGNTYIDAVSQAQDSDDHQVHIFYAANVAGGPNTVMASFSDTNNHPFLAIYEYRGVSALDQIAAAEGSDSSPNSGAAPTTSSANELVFAATGLPASCTGTVTAGSGFTMLRQDTGTSRAANEAEVVSAPGSFNGTFSLSESANWSAVIATFQ